MPASDALLNVASSLCQGADKAAGFPHLSGEQAGAVAAVALAFGRAPTGPMHPADAPASNGRSAARLPCPLRASRTPGRLMHGPVHGVDLIFRFHPHPLRSE